MRTRKLESIVFFGPACAPSLKSEVCRVLNLEANNITFSHFSDGEEKVKLDVNIREKKVIIVQPTPQPDSNWVCLFQMISSARLASAEKIIVIIPYFGYARQDRKDEPRVSIAAKDMADIIQERGANRVIIIDPHFSQIQGFFDIPCDLLYGSKVFQQRLDFSDIDTIIACDGGARKIALSYVWKYHTNYGVFEKDRVIPNQIAEIMLALRDWNIQDHNVLLVDEMIDTAKTLVKGACILKERGVTKIKAAITHGVLSGDAMTHIEESPIETLYLLDTVNVPPEKLYLSTKIKIIHSGYFIAEVIQRIDRKGSLSSLVEG